MKPFVVFLMFTVLLTAAGDCGAQQSAWPLPASRAPGVRVKLISNEGPTKTYAVIFSPGDEIVAGLTAFARKYKVQSAHFTAIGDAVTARFGWYDASRQQFKVNTLTEAAEITSLVGNIAINQDTPVVHGHINLATADGIVHGGHLLEAIVGPTVEAMITVGPAILEKKRDAKMGLSLMEPTSP